MNLETLLEYLDLESPSEFTYFENLADLVEADMDIPPETIYQLLEGIDLNTFADLVGNYFEDMMDGMPEDAVELYTLLDAVKMALIGMARNVEEEKDLVLLADELGRFQSWYSLNSIVWVQELGESRKQETNVSLRDAITLSRLEKLGGAKYEYIFEETMDFEMDQYTMSFADLAAEELAEEESSQELEDFDDEGRTLH